MSDIIDINVTPTIEQVEIVVTENLTTVNINTIQQSGDINAVKLTGNETIEDVKTFVQSPIVPTATTANQAVNFGQISDRITYKIKATYALMIADGTPTIPTIYSITNDENKSYERSTYLWKPDGKREWIATTTDN